MDYNLADSFAHGISQARILEQLPVPSLGLIHRKVLNSLTWDIFFVVFFSLIDSNSLKLVFIAKTPYISWLLPYLFEAISLKECIPSSSTQFCPPNKTQFSTLRLFTLFSWNFRGWQSCGENLAFCKEKQINKWVTGTQPQPYTSSLAASVLQWPKWVVVKGTFCP